MTLKLSNYIHELLKDNGTVIVPGFGAFITSYKPAEIREHEIIPPSTAITFSGDIRNNDGLLVGKIAEKEKISHFDALRFIEKERENIIYLLDKLEKVKLEGTGVLFLNENHEIQFIPEHDENLLLDSFGLEPVSLTETDEPNSSELTENEESTEPEKEPEDKDLNAEQIPEKSPDANSPDDRSPIAVDEHVTEENSEENENRESSEEVADSEIEIGTVSEGNEVDENVVEEIPKPVEPQPEIGNEQFEGTHSKEGNEVEPGRPEPKPVPEKEPNPVYAGTPEEKKKRGGWWYLLILIPIIIAGIFILRNQKKVPVNASSKKSVTAEQTKPEVQQNELLIDSAQNEMIAEQLIDSANSVAPVTDKTEIVVSDSLKFYLVGGGFKEEENAVTYLNELKEKGLEPFSMGKRGNFYMIGIGKYKTEAEAVRARRAYAESHPGSGAWILEEK